MCYDDSTIYRKDYDGDSRIAQTSKRAGVGVSPVQVRLFEYHSEVAEPKALRVSSDGFPPLSGAHMKCMQSNRWF